MKKRNWEKIQELYDSGLTWVEVSKQSNVAQSTLYKAIKEKKLVSRSPELSQKKRVQTRKQNGRYQHTDITRSKLSTIAINRGFGGKNYSNRIKYGDVILESSYELAVAQDLDKHNVQWTRPKRFYFYDALGKQRHYTPDFYLPKYDIYLDPKNDYLIIQDTQKIRQCSEQNHIMVYVLSKEQLMWSSIQKLAGIV